MAGFEYYCPHTLEEAVSLLAKVGPAKVIAGGTDLLLAEKRRKLKLNAVVDITRIPELQEIRVNSNYLVIGATVPHQEVAVDLSIRELFTALSEGSASVGSRQVRNLGTIGGNICNASPAADTAPALLAFNAKAKIRSCYGDREISLTDFFEGPGQTVLKDNEILTHFALPIPPKQRAGSSYIKLGTRRAMDLSIVGVGAVVVLDEAGICCDCRIALGAVAPTPIRAFRAERLAIGSKLDSDVLSEIGRIASEEASPISDVRASAEYRRDMVRVITMRAVLKAKDRAAQSL